MATVQFNTKEHPFFDTLRKRVDDYFVQHNLKPTGNWKIYLKTVVLVSAAVAIYTTLVFFTPATWLAVLLCVMLGLAFAGIGFNVMHDGAHGSYSKYPWLNEMMGYSLNLMGGDVQLWKIKHNMIHHSFTNIDGLDDDIDIQPFIRTSPHQRHYRFHRFQHIYAVVLYGLTYLTWTTRDDFKKYLTRKIGDTSFRKFTVKQHIIFWATKVFYFMLILGLPIMMVGLWPAIIGFLIMAVTTGVVIAIIFQLAHVVEETSFSDARLKGESIEDEWAVHQLRSTANFATRSKIVSWFTGGLNFQVEHHLFPRISHVHYPAVNRIVRETCAQFNIPYYEHPTLLRAVQSHLWHLRTIGRQAA